VKHLQVRKFLPFLLRLPLMIKKFNRTKVKILS
jgi:hypothetical protein